MQFFGKFWQNRRLAPPPTGNPGSSPGLCKKTSYLELVLSHLFINTLHRKITNNGIFPRWKRNSINSAISGNLINHWNMKCGQFKDPASHLCLTDNVVASWSLAQKGGRLQPFYCIDQYFESLNSANSMNHLGKTQLILL